MTVYEIRQFSRDLLIDHQLCFLHIPKTAGTSFTELLRSIFPQDHLKYIQPQFINGFEIPDFDLNDFDCICGHFTYEVYKLLKRKPLFITFLRDPINRSISNYYEYHRLNMDSPYLKQHPLYHHYQTVIEMSLEEFVNHPVFRDTVNNLQTRMLGLSIDSPVNSLSDLPAFDKKDRNFSLELAKERLEKMIFIGLQEEFSRSLELFAYLFTVYPHYQLPKLNKTDNKELLDEIPPSLLEQISELNTLDFQLYDFGLKLFDERYQMLSSELAQSYPQEEVSLKDKLELLYWEDRENSSNLLYNLVNIYPLSGWYSVEKVSERQWMWSGPETTSTIDLPINRSINLQIKFRIYLSIEDEILESLELFCDNQPVLISKEPFEEGFVFTGILTAKPGTNPEPTRFSFRVCRTAYPPGMSAETPGARLLGVALSWIEISPLK